MEEEGTEARIKEAVWTKKMIRNPLGSSVYDKETGMTIRLNHRESRLFFEDYVPQDDFGCPEVVHAEITSRCNLDCSYCYVPKVDRELGFKEWKKVIKDLSDFGAFQLTLGGGEPFLRDDVIQLANFADDCGLNVTVTTNGMFLEDFSPEELSIFRQINISYHRSAVSQGFEIAETLDRIVEADVPAGINLVLSKDYLPQLPNVTTLAKDYGALLLLLSYKPVRGDYENIVDLEKIREHAHALAKDGLTIGIDSLTCGDCEMNEKLCTISSSGEAYPCSFVRNSMGNLVSHDIQTIWKNRGEKTECPYLAPP
jgi:MoaA/NifB/PqqE/SkfB family radical SAM enzyme